MTINRAEKQVEFRCGNKHDNITEQQIDTTVTVVDVDTCIGM